MTGPSSGAPLSDDRVREIQRLLRRGEKIRAVKRVREETGFSLKEAKDAVDAIEAGRDPGGGWADGGPDRDVAAGSESPDEVQREVWDLLLAGRKIEAIKVVRERDGCDLKEAKEKVEAVVARNPGAFPKARGSGCGTVLVAGIVVLAAWFLLT